MTFAFDEQYTMFDVTPVENQFILEQMPGAKGDYVKVYLYGLAFCYHPREEVTIDTMSHELGLTRDEIMAAYRYWERHGAVRRISDHPPAWQYISFRQRSVTTETEVDPDYAAFSRELETAFEGIRSFRGSETAAVYEWKEGNMRLPTEVILMILSHMARTRGKNFRIADAEKIAVQMADENARTEDEAAAVLSRDESATAGMRKILRMMGKRYTPSDANMALYSKWTQEWKLTQEAIEEACGSMGTSDPSLALLDSILQKARENSTGTELRPEDVQRSSRKHADMKKVMRMLGRTGSATPYQEEIYGKMLQIYPQEIIMIAAEECGRKKKDPQSLLLLLQAWKDRGFTTREEIEQHVALFREREDFLKKIRSRWNSRESDAGEHGMDMLVRWEEKLGMNRDVILQAADYAAEARYPMSYIDTLMNRYAEKGISTPEEAEKDHRAYAAQYSEMARKSGDRKLPAQDFEQRDYSGEQDAAMERLLNWSKSRNNA